MLNVKAFLGIDSLISNDPNVTSPLGELSVLSRTFSKDIGEYNSTIYRGYRLYTFNSVDQNNEHATLVPSDVDFCAGIVNSIIEYAKSNIRPYNTAQMTMSLKASFQGILDTIEYGEFIETGSYALPEWIEITKAVSGSVFRIWLSDDAFKRQYDLFEIAVIPFIDNIDDMFDYFGSVNQRLEIAKVSEFMEKIQRVRDIHPETVQHIVEFNFINVNNPTQFRSVPWGVLTYGAAGDNIDARKDAIIDYILNNSERSRDEWEAIIPDLFKKIEFTLVPRWDLVAIPNLSDLSEVHRTVIDIATNQTYVLAGIGHYNPSHIVGNIELLPHPYKYLMVNVIPGENNDIELNRISKLYPDYIPVQNTALDFGRMSKETRDWCDFLFNLITVSEYMNRYNTIPTTVRRVERNGKLFVSGVYDNVNYLVEAKSNRN